MIKLTMVEKRVLQKINKEPNQCDVYNVFYSKPEKAAVKRLSRNKLIKGKWLEFIGGPEGWVNLFVYKITAKGKMFL